MIRTDDTDNYANVQSTVRKETKSPALLKLPLYSTELAAVIFLKSTVLNECTKALAAIPFSHCEFVNVAISQQQL